MANPNKKICARLATIEPNQIDPILLAVRDSLNRGIPLQDYIDQIPPARLRELTPEQQDLLNSGDPSKVVSCELDLNNPIAFLETANRYFNKFKLCQEHGQLYLYEIKDEEGKILNPINDGDPEKILIREASRQWYKETGEPLIPNLAQSMFKFWFNHIELINRPNPMGRPDDDQWCLHRSEITADSTVKFDSWLKILNRMSDPVAFAAWVAGIYLGFYKGRQILWLYGKHGEDGKSTIALLLGRLLFGSACNAISNSSISSAEKRFLASYFEDAELVIYPDASNRKCLMSEALKSIASAGSDPILIEKKGKQAYTTTLNARLWISSNYTPEITGDNFVTSRLLLITIDKMVDEKPDPTVVERLTTELPGFLAYAIDCYKKRCPDNYKIVTDDSINSTVNELSDSFYDEYEIIFSKYWQQADETQRVEASKLRDAARKEGLRSNIELKNFVEWLAEYKGVTKRKLSTEKGKVFYYGMCRQDDSVLPDNTPDF